MTIMEVAVAGHQSLSQCAKHRKKGRRRRRGEKASSGAVTRMWVEPIGERDGRRFTRGHERQSLRPALRP